MFAEFLDVRYQGIAENAALTHGARQDGARARVSVCVRASACACVLARVACDTFPTAGFGLVPSEHA